MMTTTKSTFLNVGCICGLLVLSVAVNSSSSSSAVYVGASPSLSQYAGRWALTETWDENGRRELPPANGDNGRGPFVFEFEEQPDGNLDVYGEIVNSIFTFIKLSGDDDEHGESVNVLSGTTGNEIEVGFVGSTKMMTDDVELRDLEKYLEDYLPEMKFIITGDDDDGGDGSGSSKWLQMTSNDDAEDLGAIMIFEVATAAEEEQEEARTDEAEEACKDKKGKIKLSSGKRKKCSKLKKKNKCDTIAKNGKKVSDLCPLSCCNCGEDC